jgi:hypothetical protein
VRKLDPRSYRSVPGRYYDTPKELWGFRSERGRGTPLHIARAFLEANAETLGVDVEALFRGRPRIVHGLGATHVILQQRWKRRRVHRAYVTVHVATRDHRVYLVKSRAAPRDVLQAAPDDRVSEARAVSRAVARVRRRGRTRVVGAPELLWYPAKRLLHPAWRVRVHRSKPRAELIVYVSAETGAILQVYDNLAAVTGTGRVFLPNPMARDRTFQPLDDDGVVQRPTPRSYADVRLGAMEGKGWLDGARASTRLTMRRLRRRDLDFTVSSHQAGFEEVSAYYHVDTSLAYLESLGYTGRHRIFADPIAIDARGTRDDNSWYSPGERTLTFGLGDVDDAEDGETVLHELGHALQDAICPDFGQSLEAAAMGEGFGDYWAASAFERRKPAAYRQTVMSWDGVYGDGDPPGVRRVDSPHTYETFDHSPTADEHENGEIWSATLWEVREALGRRLADRLIVESHFQLDGFTTFARGGRAILDADRNLHGGAHEARLRSIFRHRGIGPVE